VRTGNLSKEQEERLKNGDLSVLLERALGKPLMWVDGEGWVEQKKGKKGQSLKKTEDSALRLEWILKHMTDIPVVYEKDWDGSQGWAVREYHFNPRSGHPKTGPRADVALIWAKLIIECDGGTQMVVEGENGTRSVGGAHATDRDRDRNNFIAIMGWRRMSFSPQKLQNEPDDVVRQIYLAIGREYAINPT